MVLVSFLSRTDWQTPRSWNRRSWYRSRTVRPCAHPWLNIDDWIDHSQSIVNQSTFCLCCFPASVYGVAVVVVVVVVVIVIVVVLVVCIRRRQLNAARAQHPIYQPANLQPIVSTGEAVVNGKFKYLMTAQNHKCLITIKFQLHAALISEPHPQIWGQLSIRVKSLFLSLSRTGTSWTSLDL